MISYESIGHSAAIALVYLFIIPFQLIIFPMNYFSVKESIYNSSIKKAVKALVSRFFFIFVVCLLSKALGLSNRSVFFGITIGSFLCTWPSIYKYQLFVFWKNKSTLLYFISCMISIFFSSGSTWLIIKKLLPVIFGEGSFYLLENDGISFIGSILSICAPFGIRGLLNKDGQGNPYIDSDTFLADLCLTKRKILFEYKFERDYMYEIQKSAEKYRINEDLLTTIIQLERINRDIFIVRLLEKIGVKFVKWYFIKRDATVGIAQVSVSSAKEYFHEAPQKYLPKMLDITTGIDLCAFTIRHILDSFEGINIYNDETYQEFADMFDSEYITLNQKLSIYLASEYVCGTKVSLQKFALVYSILIEEANPVSSLPEIMDRE